MLNGPPIFLAFVHGQPSVLEKRSSIFTSPQLSSHVGREAKPRKCAHPCPHCLTKFPSPSARDAHARAVHEKWRDYYA
jgi:hypothetical protein